MYGSVAVISMFVCRVTVSAVGKIPWPFWLWPAARPQQAMQSFHQEAAGSAKLRGSSSVILGSETGDQFLVFKGCISIAENK